MGSGHALKETTRPVKKDRERRRRIKNHKARLVELGASEEALKKMTPKQMRSMLVSPKKTKKLFA